MIKSFKLIWKPSVLPRFAFSTNGNDSHSHCFPPSALRNYHPTLLWVLHTQVPWRPSTKEPKFLLGWMISPRRGFSFTSVACPMRRRCNCISPSVMGLSLLSTGVYVCTQGWTSVVHRDLVQTLLALPLCCMQSLEAYEPDYTADYCSASMMPYKYLLSRDTRSCHYQ